MKGFGSAETSDGRASPDGFIRLIRAEIWMAHPRGPKEMKFEVSAHGPDQTNKQTLWPVYEGNSVF
jgi:hypothetical protein